MKGLETLNQMRQKVKIQFVIFPDVALKNISLLLPKNGPLGKTLNSLISISKSKIAP